MSDRFSIQLCRVYDVHPPFSYPAFLVDRLWPRGIRHEQLNDAIWLKEVAPSTTLRQIFHRTHDWASFASRYQAELTQHEYWRVMLPYLQQQGTIILLYASKNTQYNHAVVLRHFVLSKIAED